jgi:hypothetical protein
MNAAMLCMLVGVSLMYWVCWCDADDDLTLVRILQAEAQSPNGGTWNGGNGGQWNGGNGGAGNGEWNHPCNDAACVQRGSNVGLSCSCVPEPPNANGQTRSVNLLFHYFIFSF